MDWDRALNGISVSLSRLKAPATGKPLTWFINFGTLLSIIRDDKLKKHDDFDIGIFYEEYDQRPLENAFLGCGLEIKYRLLHDITRKPLKYTLVSKGQSWGRLEMCVFCWYLHKGIRWHTFDVRHEGKKIPSKYEFKGIPAQYLDGDPVKMVVPGTYRQIQMPAMYGTCLDIWYPDWKTKRDHISKTPWQIEMKTCAAFDTEKYDVVKWQKNIV